VPEGQVLRRKKSSVRKSTTDLQENSSLANTTFGILRVNKFYALGLNQETGTGVTSPPNGGAAENRQNGLFVVGLLLRKRPSSGGLFYTKSRSYMKKYNNTSPPSDPEFIKWMNENSWEKSTNKMFQHLWYNVIFVMPPMPIFDLYNIWYKKFINQNHVLKERVAKNLHLFDLKD